MDDHERRNGGYSIAELQKIGRSFMIVVGLLSVFKTEVSQILDANSTEPVAVNNGGSEMVPATKFAQHAAITHRLEVINRSSFGRSFSPNNHR